MMAPVIECHTDCQIYRPGNRTSEIADVIGRCGEVPASIRSESLEGVIKMMTRKIKLTQHKSARISPGDNIPCGDQTIWSANGLLSAGAAKGGDRTRGVFITKTSPLSTKGANLPLACMTVRSVKLPNGCAVGWLKLYAGFRVKLPLSSISPSVIVIASTLDGISANGDNRSVKIAKHLTPLAVIRSRVFMAPPASLALHQFESDEEQDCVWFVMHELTFIVAAFRMNEE
jgi:hypothetical protein